MIVRVLGCKKDQKKVLDVLKKTIRLYLVVESNNPPRTEIETMSNINEKALSTRCVCCGRDLSDAMSVEMGIGPICRDYLEKADAANWPAFERHVARVINDLNSEVVQEWLCSTHPTQDSDTARKLANSLVFQAAQVEKGDRAPFVLALEFLGYAKVAEKIFNNSKRYIRSEVKRQREALSSSPLVVEVPHEVTLVVKPVVTVTVEGNTVLVKCPYNVKFINVNRNHQLGGKFNPQTKVWSFDVANKKQVWKLIKYCFNGQNVSTPSGLMVA